MIDNLVNTDNHVYSIVSFSAITFGDFYIFGENSVHTNRFVRSFASSMNIMGSAISS